MYYLFRICAVHLARWFGFGGRATWAPDPPTPLGTAVAEEPRSERGGCAAETLEEDPRQDARKPSQEVSEVFDSTSITSGSKNVRARKPNTKTRMYVCSSEIVCW